MYFVPAQGGKRRDGISLLPGSVGGLPCGSDVFDRALRRAARLRVVGPEHFPGFRVNEVHLRTDRAIHRHKHAGVRSLVFLRDETLHPVPGGGALEQESWHLGAIISLVPETPTPDKHVSFGCIAVAAVSPVVDYGRLRGRLAQMEKTPAAGPEISLPERNGQ
jgi:hypothetical protein